jgi:Helix-turn-helix domain
MFRNWHRAPEELIADGELATVGLRGAYGELHSFVDQIKKAREASGLTLAEVSVRCGIDQPALSRAEDGRNKTTTLDTLWRYADAVGRRRVMTRETTRDTRRRASSRSGSVRNERGRLPCSVAGMS